MPSVTHRGLRLLFACLLAVGMAFSTASAASAATVTDIKVSDGTGTLKVEVGASGPVQHRAKTLSQPQKLIVVDIFPAVLGKDVKTSFDVNQGLVEKVRVSQYNDNTVRVYVDVISQPEYQVITASGSQGLTVAISTAQMAEGKAPSAPTETAVESPRPAPQPVAQPQPAPQPVARVSPQPRTSAPRAPQVSLAGSGSAPVSALRKRPAPKAPPKPTSKLVTLDFVNADLVYVIKVLAKEMGRNVFVGPGVDGSVTVTLKNVPVEGALALILKMQENPIEYKVLEGGTIVVAAPEKLATIPDDIIQTVKRGKAPKDSVRQEMLLEKAPAAKVMEFLTGQYKDVEFTPHPTMNGFYAFGSKEDILQIKRELPNLDRVPEPPPPPLREFISVKYGDVNEVRTLLSTLVPDVQYNVDTRLSMIIAEGSPGAVDQVKELMAELDRPLDQVMIDVKVVDLSENGRKTLGVTWGTAGGGVGNTTVQFQEAVSPAELIHITGGDVVSPASLVATPPSFVGIGISPFARTPFALEAQISYLVVQGEAKVLAAPRVATQSGKDALIHIGDKFPIVYFDPRAGQFQVQYVDIGIKLDVRPDIKTDGYILVDLRPEVSTLVELVNNQYPRTAVRTVNTSMRVKDGDTIIIGGLINEQDIQSITKVPLLGDLPILGSLFRQVSVTKSRNEVVMMLTPNIMR